MSDSLGEAVRRCRNELDLSLSALATRAFITKSYLSKVERGRSRPSPEVVRALADALGVDLFGHAIHTYAWDISTSDSIALVPERQPDGSVITMPMDRRAFLATAATAGATSVLAIPDRPTGDTVTTVADRLEWHITAGHVTNPHVVSRRVHTDLDRITAVSRHAPAGTRPALLSLAARYAEYLGWMRQEAGDHVGALYWTDRAGDYAHAVGWRHMVAYTLTRKALLVERDQPEHAVDMASAARTGPWRLSPGLTAVAAAQEAEAFAAAGNPAGVDRALGAAADAAGRIDPADEPPIGPHTVRRNPEMALGVWRARCDLLLGRTEEAIPHLSPAVIHSPSLRSRAIDGAVLAVAHAKLGSVDEACRVGLVAARAESSCYSATAQRELRTLGPALRPWAGRSDVDQVLATLAV